jgi:hypothetical protein
MDAYGRIRKDAEERQKYWPNMLAVMEVRGIAGNKMVYYV